MRAREWMSIVVVAAALIVGGVTPAGRAQASIFKPDGNGAFTLIARVPIDQWATAKK
jgi:hypothetical protein